MGKSDISALTSEDFAARRNTLLQNLTGNAATTVAVFGYGSALGMGTQSHGAMRYLTGWDSHEAMSLMVFDKDHAFLLLSSPFMFELAKKACPNVEVIAIPPAEWAASVNLRFSGAISIATIGFDEMPSLVRTQIAAGSRCECFFSADAELAKLRLVKSKSEIATMAAGASICDDLFASLGRHLLQDRPIWQSQVYLETAARLAGADYCKTWLTIRPQADYPRYWPKDSQRCPREGDQVLFGIALTVDGYFAHGIRMGSIGPARPEHQALWRKVHDALWAGRDSLGAGKSLAAVDAKMTAVLDANADDTEAGHAERFRNGHGLGTSYEEPLATHDFQQLWNGGHFAMAQNVALAIPTHSVFELHPNLFVPQIGGAALGDMFHVTEETTDPFLQFPLELFELSLHAS